MDREKNRLTSLHLIGSSCNHKNPQMMIESKGRRQNETQKDRENTATKVSSQTWLAEADKQVAADQRAENNVTRLQFITRVLLIFVSKQQLQHPRSYCGS